MRLLPVLTALITAFGLLTASAAPGQAQTPPGMEGVWVWTVEGRPVFILDLAAAPGEASTLTRPGSINLGGEGGVRGVSGPVRTDTIRTAAEDSGRLRLIAEPPGAPAPRREYVVRLIDADRLEFRFDGGPNVPPLTLYRAFAPTTVITDWGGDRIYGQVADVSGPANSELKALFDADQADRSGGPDIDWSQVAPRDRERRAATRAMLDAGQVRTADDYYHAAFIFQHGDQADDYLLAHALAVTAVAKGRADAAWIAAATLDRYLQNIGRPQIYGTQFQIPADDGPVTQGDYARDLIPDAARVAAGVPPLAEQDRQRQAYEANRP